MSDDISTLYPGCVVRAVRDIDACGVKAGTLGVVFAESEYPMREGPTVRWVCQIQFPIYVLRDGDAEVVMDHADDGYVARAQQYTTAERLSRIQVGSLWEPIKPTPDIRPQFLKVVVERTRSVSGAVHVVFYTLDGHTWEWWDEEFIGIFKPIK